MPSLLRNYGYFSVLRRNLHSNKSFVDADEAINIFNQKISAHQVSSWISRYNNRDKVINIKAENKCLVDQKSSFYLQIVSPFRNIPEDKKIFSELVTSLQPDAIIFAMEDKYKGYLNCPDAEKLAKSNSSLIKFLKDVKTMGFLSAQNYRFFHKLLYYYNFTRDSQPFNNYVTIINQSKLVNGVSIFSSARMGFRELGLSFDHVPIPVKLEWIRFGTLLFPAPFTDYLANKTYCDSLIHFIRRNPYYPLDMIAKCSNLTYNIQNVKINLKHSFEKMKLSEPSLDKYSTDPIILVIARPSIADIMIGNKKTYDSPAFDIDRFDGELYTIKDQFLDNGDMESYPLIEEVKYKASLLPPLLV